MADNESQDTKCPCISTAKGFPLRPRRRRPMCSPPSVVSPSLPIYLRTYLSSPCITGDDNSPVDEAIPTYGGTVTRETNEDTNCWKCLSLDQRGNKRARARACMLRPTIGAYLSCGDALSSSACANISIITSTRCGKAVDSLAGTVITSALRIWRMCANGKITHHGEGTSGDLLRAKAQTTRDR